MGSAYNRVSLNWTEAILYDNLLFRTIFMWAKLSVEICPDVFLKGLVTK
jgi:hypothetical protein